MVSLVGAVTSAFGSGLNRAHIDAETPITHEQPGRPFVRGAPVLSGAAGERFYKISSAGALPVHLWRVGHARRGGRPRTRVGRLAPHHADRCLSHRPARQD